MKDDEVLDYLANKVKSNIGHQKNNPDLRQLKIAEKEASDKLEKMRSAFIDAPEHSVVREDLVKEYESQTAKLISIRKEIERNEAYKLKAINCIDNIKNYLSKKIANIATEDDKKKFIDVFLCTAFVESDIVYIYLNLDNEETVTFDEYKTDLKELESNRSVRIESRMAE